MLKCSLRWLIKWFNFNRNTWIECITISFFFILPMHDKITLCWDGYGNIGIMWMKRAALALEIFILPKNKNENIFKYWSLYNDFWICLIKGKPWNYVPYYMLLREVICRTCCGLQPGRTRVQCILRRCINARFKCS